MKRNAASVSASFSCAAFTDSFFNSIRPVSTGSVSIQNPKAEVCHTGIPSHLPMRRVFLSGILLWILMVSTGSPLLAQGDPGPQPTSPPQLAVLGSALSHLKAPWLEERFSRRQGITAWRFFHAAANGPSDIYLGSLQISPSPLPPSSLPPSSIPPSSIPPMLSTGSVSAVPAGGDHLRFVYLHNNRSLPPSPGTDFIFAAPVLPRSPARSMPLLLSTPLQLELLIQVCEWQQPGQTPPPLQGFHDWLDLPQTRITQIRARSVGLRILLEFTAEEMAANGSVNSLHWEISAEKNPAGNFVDLEVTP